MVSAVTLIKRFITFCVIALLLGGGAIVWLALRAGEQGDTPIEKWIGQQVISMVDARLHPSLSFKDLDYQYPATVRVKDLRLTADDARAAGGKVDVISAAEAVLTLAEVPAVGQPIRIERITLSRPSVRLLRDPAKSQFIGLTNMVKKSPATQPASTQSVQERFKEALEIRRIELIDGQIEYNPGTPNADVMNIGGITALLEVQPETAGHYRIQANFGRKPMVEASVRGLLDLDQLNFGDIAIHATTNVDESNLEFLPPQMQRLIRKYSARGTMTIEATGQLPLAMPANAKIDARLALAEANLLLGEYVIPVKALQGYFGVVDGSLWISKLTAQGLQGSAELNGNVALSGPQDSELELTLRDISLEEFVAAEKRSDSSLCGKMNGTLIIYAPLRVLAARFDALDGTARPSQFTDEPWPTRWGVGNFEITEACLVKVPVLNNITSALESAANLVTGRGAPKRREKLSLNFEMIEDRIHFQQIEYVGDVIAGRGTGTISLAQQLNLSFSGTPVDKFASAFGSGVGGMVEKVTSTVAAYNVTGTIAKPQVTVQVAPGVTGGIERLGDMFRGKSKSR